MSTEPRKYTAAEMACIEQHRYPEDNDFAEHPLEEFTTFLEAFGIDIKKNAHRYAPKGPDGKFLKTPDGSFVPEKVYYTRDISWAIDCRSDTYFVADSFTIAEFMDAGRLALTPPVLAPGEVEREDYSWFATSDDPVIKCLCEQLAWCEATYDVCRLNGVAWRTLQGASVALRTADRGTMYVDEIEGCQYDADDSDMPPDIEQLCIQIGETADTWQEFLRDLAHALHKNLAAEYEYQTSDDAVWEMIESNDLFDPDESVDEDEDAEQAA